MQKYDVLQEQQEQQEEEEEEEGISTGLIIPRADQLPSIVIGLRGNQSTNVFFYLLK